ncbi:MAG: hypothetical protein ACE5R4_16575 [Armatimonadota bacterium]
MRPIRTHMEPSEQPTDEQPRGAPSEGLLYALVAWLSASAIAVALSLWQRSFLGPAPYGFVFLGAPAIYVAKAAWYLATCAVVGLAVRWCSPRHAWVVATFAALAGALPLLPPTPIVAVPTQLPLARMLYNPWLPYLDKVILVLGIVLAARLAHRRA